MPAGSASKARAAAAFRPSTSMMSSDGAPRAKEISCSAVMRSSLRAGSIEFFRHLGRSEEQDADRYPSGFTGVPKIARPEHMIGLVLAAGAGRRLRPYTDTLP